MKLFLKPQGLKMGEVKYCALQGFDTNIQRNFLGWVHPVDRDLFIHTDKYLESASTTTFSLHTLMPWSNLAVLRSGLSSS